jgi:hypothetical protein
LSISEASEDVQMKVRLEGAFTDPLLETKTFVVTAGDFAGYVIADSMHIVEDNGDYNTPSSLMLEPRDLPLIDSLD